MIANDDNNDDGNNNDDDLMTWWVYSYEHEWTYNAAADDDVKMFFVLVCLTNIQNIKKNLSLPQK